MSQFIDLDFKPSEQSLKEFQKFISKLENVDFKVDLDVDTKPAQKDIEKFADKSEKEISEGLGNAFKQVQKESEGIFAKVKNSFSDSFSGAFLGAGAFSVIQNGFSSIASAAGAAFDSYKQFDSAVQNIATLGVVEDLEGLKTVLNDVSKTTVDDASVLANATYQALSAGVKGSNEELGKFVQTASKVATAGGSDAETAVDALTTVMNAFKLSTDQADMVSDQFFGTIKAGKTSFPELAGSLSNVASIASTAGIKFGEVGGSIAQLTALGTPTSVATNQLKSLITELIAPASATAKTFESLGFNTKELAARLKEPVEEGGGLVNVMADVEKASSKAGLTLFDVFSSSEAAAAGLALSGDNAASAINNVNAVLVDSAGSAEFAYSEASTSIENQLGLIKGSIQALFNDIFMFFEPFIKDFLGGFATAFDFIVNSLSAVKNSIVTFFTNIANSPFAQLISETFTNIKNTILDLIPTIDEIKSGFETFKQIISDLSPLIVFAAGAFAAYQISVNSAAIATQFFNIASKAAAIAQGVVNTVTALGSGILTAAAAAYNFVASGQAIATVKTYLFAAAQKVLNLVLSLNPIGLVVTALAALAAGFIYAYKQSEDFRKIVDNLYKKAIKPLIDGLADGVKRVLRFFGLLSDEPDTKGLEKVKEKEKEVVDETDKTVKSQETLQTTIKETGKVAEKPTLDGLINKLAELRIKTDDLTNANDQQRKTYDRILKQAQGLVKNNKDLEESTKKVKDELNLLTAEADKFLDFIKQSQDRVVDIEFNLEIDKLKRDVAEVGNLISQDLDVEGLDFSEAVEKADQYYNCLLYTSPSPRDRQKSRMPSSA